MPMLFFSTIEIEHNVLSTADKNTEAKVCLLIILPNRKNVRNAREVNEL